MHWREVGSAPSRARHRRGAAVLSFVLILLAPLAAASAESFYYEATTTDRLENGKERSRVLVRGWVDEGKGKVEFTDTQGGTMFKDGGYLLTKDGGATLYLVDPKEKSYMEWDVDQMFATMAALLDSTGPLLNIDFSNPSSQKLGESDGGTLLGHPTKKYQWQSAYDMQMKVLGMKRQYHVEQMMDFWATDRLDDKGFAIWLRPDRVKTGDQELDQILTSDMGRINGFPLKSVITTKMTTGKGKTQTSVSTMEVTTLREESIAGSSFELPADYKRVEFLPGMPPQGEGQGGTQTTESGAGDDGETASGEEEEGGGPLKGLKGVFGRKNKKNEDG